MGKFDKQSGKNDGLNQSQRQKAQWKWGLFSLCLSKFWQDKLSNFRRTDKLNLLRGGIPTIFVLDELWK